MGEEIQNPEDEDALDLSVSYLNEIAKIKKSSQQPDIKLDMLNLLIKDFLRKKYHVKKNLEYSELINYFLDKKKPHVATFCHEMVEELYGGEELTEPGIQIILEDAKNMMMKEFDVNEDGTKTSIKKLLTPFANLKKTEKPVIDTDHVSKQTKRIIDKNLGNNEKPIRESESENVDLEEREELESLKTKLNLSNKNKIDATSLLDNPEKIQNIDDLERIKTKIKLRKIDNYQQNQG